MENRKAHSATKTVVTRGPLLTEKKLSTMKSISDFVGVTYGPGGLLVAIEKPEPGSAPLVTKDGVTAFKSMGFRDPIQQNLMEIARDAAIKTANEAGDGTTTASILSEAFVRGVHQYCEQHRIVAPQVVSRGLFEDFENVLKPCLDGLIIRPGSCDFTDTEKPAFKTYLGVATVSANGDTDLANAVIDCYRLVGDYGNVTILEASGDSQYEVEPMNGYFLGSGYQDLGQFYPAFVNDAARQTVSLVKPRFLLYFGKINTLNSLYAAINDLAADYDQRNETGSSQWENHDLVVVATGFSEQVLGTLAAGFPESAVLNVYPLVVPKLPMQNGQLQFLQDLAAITGATIFDPLNRPLETCTTDDLGPGVEAFEAHGFKSSVIGFAEGTDEAVLKQADAIRVQLANPESTLERIWLQERLAKITNGIAKLIVRGSSTGEVRERKDRAEDAVCAVKGAIHHGVLPGGAWAMERLAEVAKNCKHEASREIFTAAFKEPLRRLLDNAGIWDPQRIEEIRSELATRNDVLYNAASHEFVPIQYAHIYDSAQAVLEAIKNSLSIASTIGTLGAMSVFERDDELERREAQSHHQAYREMQDYKG